MAAPAVSTANREQLLDELARCYMRAALNQLLAEHENKNADGHLELPRRREGNNGADDNGSEPARAS